MVGMLYHGNPQALRDEMRDKSRQQRGLPGAAPSGEADHLHVILRADENRASHPTLLYIH
jgi:hypothetical protein